MVKNHGLTFANLWAATSVSEKKPAEVVQASG